MSGGSSLDTLSAHVGQDAQADADLWAFLRGFIYFLSTQQTFPVTVAHLLLLRPSLLA